MPGRQLIAYNKCSEAIAKRDLHWFVIWKIDRADPNATVWRVETRCGKAELQGWNIRTFDYICKKSCSDCRVTTLSIMTDTHPHADASYRLSTLADGTFAVEVAIPDTKPTKVSGLDTQEKAEAWIERHKANIATGSLKGAFALPFRQRSLPSQ